MKKTLLGILPGIVTFFIGLTSFYYVQLLTELDITAVEEPVDVEIVRTSACELGDESNDSFVGKTVELEATTFVNGYGMLTLYPNVCIANGRLSWWPALDLERFDGRNSNLKSLLEQSDLEVDVRVTGIARRTLLAGKEKMYSIQPTKIILISPFRKFRPKGSA